MCDALIADTYYGFSADGVDEGEMRAHSKGSCRKYNSMAGSRIGGRFHCGGLPIANGASRASAH